MDKATLIGNIAAFGLVIAAIAIGGSAGAFIDPASLLIVVGGTVGAAMISLPLSQFTGAIAVAKNAFFEKSKNPAELVGLMVEFAGKARKEGILALESAAKEQDDPFLQKALQLAVDGQSLNAIEDILTTEIDAIRQRQQKRLHFFLPVGGEQIIHHAVALGVGDTRFPPVRREGAIETTQRLKAVAAADSGLIK